MKVNWLYLQSHCSQEFYDQCKKLFSETRNGVPFDFEKWERTRYTSIVFKGTWTRFEYIGDIVFGDNDELIITDGLPDRKLSRLVKRLVGSISHIIVLFDYDEADRIRESRFWHSVLSDYLAIEHYEKNTDGARGISKGEWKGLYSTAVRKGYYDIAKVAYGQLLIRKMGWENTRTIRNEQYETALKLMHQWDLILDEDDYND